MTLAAMCNATATRALASVSPSLRSTRAGAARVGRRTSRLRLPRAVPTSVDASETTEAESPEPLLIVVECDGVLCDVHLDGHREAFNETFTELGMEGMSWSPDEYLSLLRSGGGTAYGMVERYFHFYGYPTPELRDPGSDIPDEVGGKAKNLGIVPEGYENASLASQAAAAQAAASRDPINKELLAMRRAEWIHDVIARKDANFARMVEEGRLRLRKGALAFLDECLLEDNAQVVIIGATASAPEENVLGAVLHAMGPLRAAAISVSDANEIIDGAALAGISAALPDALRPTDQTRATKHMDDDALAAFGDHEGVHDEAWEAARREMAMTMKAKKGELLAVEVGGDLHRQSFNSDVIVDASVFCTSTRSVINAGILKNILKKKNVRKERCVFVGASRATATEANAAGVFNVVCRTANQADSQIVGVAMVTDDFGGGGGLTLRYVKHRMASWKGETVGGSEI
jgi:phosphoglycolate phosphatase-like HAD superfamily hydrolase